MPSETMKSRDFSPSSFFSDELCFSNERQVGVRKVEHVTSYSGLKSDGSLQAEGVSLSPLGNRLASNSQMEKGFGLPEFYLNRGRNMSIGKHVVGTEREAGRSLPGVCHDRGARANLDMESASHFIDGNRVNLMGTQYENSLFSSSLSDLFSRNLKLSFDSAHAHSVGVGAATTQDEEEEAFESLEEIEAQTIGNLLPDDDDLFSGVTDGLDSVIQSRNGEDIEDIDLFSNVGGLELGEDGFSRRNTETSDVNSTNQIGSGSFGEHPSGERPSRTLFVRSINSNVEDAELRTLFEQFGDIRTLYTACKHRGFFMISYFDIRAACKAMKAMQNKPLGHRKLDIHFSIPKDNPSEKDMNTGILVVFNLDSTVSNEEICKIFGGYGEIKEIRKVSDRSNHKVVEYYDIRAAESALHALNNCEIAGKQIRLEPGQPSILSARSTELFSFEREIEDSCFLSQQHSLPSNLETAFPGPLSLRETVAMNDNGLIMGPRSTNGSVVMSPLMDNALHHWISSSVPNSLSSTTRGEPENKPTAAESGHMRNHLMFELSGSPNLHPHSLPEYHDNLANGPPFNSSSTMAANIRATEMIDGHQFRRVGSNMQPMELNEAFGSSGNGRHFMWNNSHHPQAQPMLWPGSPSFMNGISAARPQQLNSVPRAPAQMINAFMASNNHNVGSAPSVNHSIWERRHSHTGEPTDASAVFHHGSLGNMRIPGNSPHPLEFVHPNMFSQAGGNGMDVQIASKNMGFHQHNQRGMIFPTRGQMLPMMGSFDSPNERSRSRRNEGSSNVTDNKKQFELDIDRILRGEDKRTTLMLKNIPNKYTSKMLLAAIDERHKGTYDFIYLPIDFKNKCNVGYAFINMTDPSLIVPFHETFSGKKWEKFNSEKVASLAYARIQGKDALIAHFQNSSLMNEDRRCRPILFNTDGPNAGDQVPFPVGSNIRSRPGKVRASTSEENSQEMSRNSSTGEEFSNGDLSSGSGKDLD